VETQVSAAFEPLEAGQPTLPADAPDAAASATLIISREESSVG
jgi:hypothetical protein